MKNSFVRSLTVLADGREVAAGCHLRLIGSETMSLDPGLFHLTVEDLPPFSKEQISEANILEVRSGASVLASGTVDDIYSCVWNGKNQTTVSFTTGFDLWESTVSFTAQQGVRATDLARAVLMLSGTGVQLAGFTGVEKIMTRSQSYLGRTADVLSLLAKLTESYVYLSPAGLVLAGKADYRTTVRLEAADLLSAPSRVSGCTVLRTNMVGWPFGVRARFTWEGVTEEGRIFSRAIDADNVSGPWRSELLIGAEK
ncbi:MAG: hypothetical protein K5922_05010 [Clostridiales bacterium]|nr:hypothetical protein [Clostridiales bacterium]